MHWKSSVAVTFKVTKDAPIEIAKFCHDGASITGTSRKHLRSMPYVVSATAAGRSTTIGDHIAIAKMTYDQIII